MPHLPLNLPNEVRDPDPKLAHINSSEQLASEVDRVVGTLRNVYRKKPKNR